MVTIRGLHNNNENIHFYRVCLLALLHSTVERSYFSPANTRTGIRSVNSNALDVRLTIPYPRIFHDTHTRHRVCAVCATRVHVLVHSRVHCTILHIIALAALIVFVAVDSRTLTLRPADTCAPMLRRRRRRRRRACQQHCAHL